MEEEKQVLNVLNVNISILCSFSSIRTSYSESS